MNKKLTIEDVKKKKIELEGAILKLVQGFEKECGVRASYISMDRKRDNETAPEPVAERSGPVENVEVRMELDLVY
jgi:hypothetical protein